MTPMADRQGNHDAVFALADAPGDLDGVRWYAARQSGLYLSEDNGKTWRDTYRSMGLQSSLTTAAVAVSPQFGIDRTVFAGALGGVLRSTDCGETWTVARLPDPPPYVVALAVSPCYEVDGLVFAATMEDGVFRSWDRGTSWASWNFGLLDLGVFSLAISPGFAVDDTLFVGTDSGIFRSANGGRAWRELAFPMDYAPVLSLALSPDFTTDHTMVAGTESQGVFRSEDRGDTWERVLGWEPSCAVNQLVYVPRAGGRRTLVALAGRGLHCSMDGGAGWFEIPLPGNEAAVPTCICPLGGRGAEYRLLVGYDDGRVLQAEMNE